VNYGIDSYFSTEQDSEVRHQVRNAVDFVENQFNKMSEYIWGNQ